MACVYPAVKLIHELAHALAVRRFGGAVTQVGVMFLVFVPMPYVDASQANAFRSHSARRWSQRRALWPSLRLPV